MSRKVYGDCLTISFFFYFLLRGGGSDRHLFVWKIEMMLLTSFVLMFPLVCYSCFVLIAEISLIVGAVLKL